MKETHAASDAVTRHLLEAIEQVRDDVAKVEFWACAVAGFAQPVPDYAPDDGTVWLPNEQANTLRSRRSEPTFEPRKAHKSRRSKSDTRERG